MKFCPLCRTEYNDAALRFCLQDGTPLVNSEQQPAPPNFDNESETVIAPKRVEPIRFDPPSSYQYNQTNREPSQPLIVEPAPKRSNTAAIVALSVLATILVLGLGGIGALLYFNSKKTVAVVNNNSNAAVRPTNLNAAGNQNSNTNSSVNAATPTPTPSPLPIAKPTINPETAKRGVV